jgi:hypothetical protein
VTSSRKAKYYRCRKSDKHNDHNLQLPPDSENVEKARHAAVVRIAVDRDKARLKLACQSPNRRNLKPKKQGVTYEVTAVAAHGLLVALRAGAEKERGAVEADRDVRALEQIGEERVRVPEDRLEVDALGLRARIVSDVKQAVVAAAAAVNVRSGRSCSTELPKTGRSRQAQWEQARG